MKMTPETKAMPIDIGIPDEQRKEIAEGLSRLLADTYTLYLKTHNYHWNVTGPMFNTLHLMFEQQYNELSLAVEKHTVISSDTRRRNEIWLACSGATHPEASRRSESSVHNAARQQRWSEPSVC